MLPRKNRTWLAASCAAALLTLAAAATAQELPAGVTTQKDVTYGMVNGKPLKLDVYRPAGARPDGADAATGKVIIRISPTREAPSGAAAQLLKDGATLIYAGYMPGESTDRVFSAFPQDVQAAKAAVRWARHNFPGDSDHIGVWGTGHGATIAALLGVTPDEKDLNGTIGDYPGESNAVSAVCLFEGVTDWRYAELYGDEMVNVPGSPAYQLFGGNPKEHPDDARRASAVNYIRPSSPPTLMVTLASDEQRAMHLIFAETLRKAGVRSALYEEPLGGGRGVDEDKRNNTVVEFFADTLKAPRAPMPTLDNEIDSLTKDGLFKQARRLIDEKMSSFAGSALDTAAGRAPWLKKLREINDLQQQPALQQLLAAKKANIAPEGIGMPRTIWTIREVLTDPERIGQYTVEATVPQKTYDERADALRFVETLNNYIQHSDTPGADRQAEVMRTMARNGDADPAILNEFLGRYNRIRGSTTHVWPSGVHGVAYANDFGQDLYGFWMIVKAGGIEQRFRYVAPGRFVMGSGKDEWGRLPGEPLLEPTEITKGFWLADAPVTQGLWEGVMGKDDNHAMFRLTGNNAEVRLNLPMENISYAHAVNFLSKLGLNSRLPSEAEYEYALRAGTTYMYAGTGRLSDMAWFWDEKRDKNGTLPTAATPVVSVNGEVDIQILHDLVTDTSDATRLTHPVRQKLPNRWGLYDMQGDVWEWCTGTNPDKPRDYHPAKGGSWISIPQSCRAARDAWLPVEQQSWNLGMRVLIPAE